MAIAIHVGVFRVLEHRGFWLGSEVPMASIVVHLLLLASFMAKIQRTTMETVGTCIRVFVKPIFRHRTANSFT